ncbi:MAG: tetratricopeptide repeat protein [Planctomycetota bacterium]
MFKFINPFNWLKWGGQFTYAYLLSIPWREAPKAIPALILLVVVMVGGAIAYSDGGSWRNTKVNRQLATALDADDYETAELVLRRQLSDRPDDTDVMFRLGLIRYEQDANQDAIEMMQQLVRSQRHLEAAQWLIQNEYIGKNWAQLEEEQREEFGSLLELIAEERPKDMGIKQLLADYLVTQQRFAAAIPLLRELAEVRPMRGLQAAALYRRLGNQASADKMAELTLERVDQLFEEEPANPILALAVVQNQLFLKRFQEAVASLNQSIGRMKTDEHRKQLQQAMGDTIVAWIQHIEEQANETATERLRVLKMLQLALQYAPQNPRVLTLVADQILRTIESDDDAVIAVRNALVRGTSPGIAHFVRGTTYLIKENPEKASLHLKLAAELLPNSSAILNNLAVALSAKEEPDLESALKMVEQAIAQTAKPGAYFYDTRGQIHFQMKNYMKAIPDFERALTNESLSATAHDRLAVCYDELGEPGLAEEHRIAGQELAAKLEEDEEAIN